MYEKFELKSQTKKYITLTKMHMIENFKKIVWNIGFESLGYDERISLFEIELENENL